MYAKWYRIAVVTVLGVCTVGLGVAPARGHGLSAGSAVMRTAQVQQTPFFQRVAYNPLVQQIQRGLNALGYDAGPEDGVMGSRTRSAIEAYQRQYDLLVTGQPSRSLLNHIEEKWAARHPTATTTQEELITDLQAQLRALEYDVRVTGRLDTATQEAIRSYQQEHNLLVTGQPSAALLERLEQTVAERREPGSDLVIRLQSALRALEYDVRVTGRLDAATQEAIRSYQQEHNLLVTGQPSAALLDHIEQTVAEQQEPGSDLVARIQSALRQRGYDIGVVSGRMDAATETAIREYQHSRGLRVTGQPSQELLSLLEEGQPQEAQLSQREQIQQVQEALKARGYEAGPADGVMGPSTRNAIRTYQSDAGMPVTGQISPELLTSLDVGGEVAAEAGATGEEAAKTEEGEASQPSFEASQPSFEVRVSDDFADGNYTANPSWTVLAGDFIVQSGRLTSTVRADAVGGPQEIGKALLRNVIGSALGVRLPGLGGAAAIALQRPIRNAYKITAELAGSGGDGHALVNLGTYQGNDAANGYRLVFDEQAGQQLKLVISTDKGVSAVASTNVAASLMDGSTHTLEWDRDSEGRMTVSVDGAMVIDTSDQTYQHDFDGFSFINGGGTWSLDSLTVYEQQMQ
jgi:peptidoglycan hydrolase-like protein with peptidoglycan-binding domain